MEQAAMACETADEQIKRMITQYGDALLRMCCVQLRDAHLAEDAEQETFFKAYQGIAGFRGECGEKTWLMRIAINVCRDYQRKAWFKWVDRRVPVEEITLAGGQPPSPRDDTVLREVMRLPARDREVVLLRYYQDMKLGEISKALGVPEGTVTSRLNRVRAKLRARLEGWYLE